MKKLKIGNALVQEYWIVDLQKEKVEVWKLKDNAFILDGVFEKQDILQSSLLKGLEINLSEVFRKLED